MFVLTLRVQVHAVAILRSVETFVKYEHTHKKGISYATIMRVPVGEFLKFTTLNYISVNICKKLPNCLNHQVSYARQR